MATPKPKPVSAGAGTLAGMDAYRSWEHERLIVLGEIAELQAEIDLKLEYLAFIDQVIGG